MSRKNKGLRTCLYSNKQFTRQEMIRLVKVNGQLMIDHKKNMPGRGYWLKLTNQAIKDPKLFQILSKRTKCSMNDAFIKELTKYEETKK